MTSTAADEIAHLDFEAAGSSREVGDLQLAGWNSPPLAGVLPLGKPREGQHDVVVVMADSWGEERATNRTLTLPRAALVAVGCDASIPSCLVLEPDRPLVGVLLVVLDEAWSRVPAMSASEVEATRAALVALTAGVIRAESGSATPRSGLPALRAQLDEWINDNLRSGPIHIEDLAAVFNVSARTVHRAFSLTGDTMTAVVRARRLAAVREDLVHTDMTIAAIANRWCYFDPSHLGREFRRHFGASPSEYRESHGC